MKRRFFPFCYSRTKNTLHAYTNTHHNGYMYTQTQTYTLSYNKLVSIEMRTKTKNKQEFFEEHVDHSQ